MDVELRGFGYAGRWSFYVNVFRTNRILLVCVGLTVRSDYIVECRVYIFLNSYYDLGKHSP